MNYFNGKVGLAFGVGLRRADKVATKHMVNEMLVK